MAVDVERVKQRHPIAERDRRARRRAATDRAAIRRAAVRSTTTTGRASSSTRTRAASTASAAAAAGDVIDFVRRAHDVGFRGAVASSGELPPWEPVRPARRAVRRSRARLSLDDRLILTAACELYHETLLRTPGAALPRGARRPSVARPALPSRLQRRAPARPVPEAPPAQPPTRGGDRPAVRRRPRGDARTDRDPRPARRALRLDGRARPVDDAEPKYRGLALPRPLLGFDGSARSPARVPDRGAVRLADARRLGPPGVRAARHAARHGHAAAARPRALGRARARHRRARARGARAARGTLGDRAAVLALPDGVKDVNELGVRPDGREAFFQALDEAERRARDVASAH